MIIANASPMLNKEILNGLSEITTWVLNWAVLLAAIGTVSMALIQTAKNVFPLRSRFQMRRFRRWLEATAARAPKSLEVPVDAVTAENSATAPESLKLEVRFLSAECDLISLAASGDEKAFYDLPIEQMCTQIRGIAPVVLDYPAKHEALLYCLVSQSNPTDIARVLTPPSPELFSKRPDLHTHAEKIAVKEYAAAKARLAAQMRCTIDAIQTSIGFRWKHWLQVTSVLLSAALGVVALQAGLGPNGAGPTVAATVTIGVLSGFLAPVARDLVAALEKVRI